MKRFFIILFLFAALMARAEAPSYTHENILQMRYGGEYVLDSYHSAAPFSGWQVGLGAECWKTPLAPLHRGGEKTPLAPLHRGGEKTPLAPLHRGEEKTPLTPLHRGEESANSDKGVWQSVGQVDFAYSMMRNQTKQNLIQGIHIEAGWAALYSRTYALEGGKHLDGQSIEWLVGPAIDADVMGKLLSRNTNKPVSLDIGLDAEVMAGVAYRFWKKETAYRLRYLGRLNLVGVEWLPDYWQSYFEAYEGAALKGNIRPSYIGNRQFIHQEITLDMQFKRSTWRVGVRHEYLRYGTSDLPFRRQEISVVVGALWQSVTKRTSLK